MFNTPLDSLRTIYGSAQYVPEGAGGELLVGKEFWMSDRKCSPCDQLCRQGRDCPAGGGYGFDDDQGEPVPHREIWPHYLLLVVGSGLWLYGVYKLIGWFLERLS